MNRTAPPVRVTVSRWRVDSPFDARHRRSVLNAFNFWRKFVTCVRLAHTQSLGMFLIFFKKKLIREKGNRPQGLYMRLPSLTWKGIGRKKTQEIINWRIGMYS